MAPTTVAYLGPQGTYTHQAAREHFKDSPCTFIPLPTIQSVFLAIASREAPIGVIPIENSSFGSVVETYDALRDSSVGEDMIIVGEQRLSIRHCLLAKSGTKIEDVRGVYSHVQALGQCAEYIKRTLPLATTHSTPSTGAAVQMLLDSNSDEYGHRAAVASELLATLHAEIEVLARDIQDMEGNKTRFIILANKFDLASLSLSLYSSPSSTSQHVLIRYTSTQKPAPTSDPEITPPKPSQSHSDSIHLASQPDLNTSQTEDESIHLEALLGLPFAQIPARAITRVDRRPALAHSTAAPIASTGSSPSTTANSLPHSHSQSTVEKDSPVLALTDNEKLTYSFHQTLFLELDLGLISQEEEGRVANQVLIQAVASAKLTGECDVIGAW